MIEVFELVKSPAFGTYSLTHSHTHTHTHPFNGPLSGTTRVRRYQKGKTNLDFTEARDSEWQWHQLGRMQVCTSLQTDNHASTPPLSFYRPDALPAAQPTVSKHWRRTYTHFNTRYGEVAITGIWVLLMATMTITTTCATLCSSVSSNECICNNNVAKVTSIMRPSGCDIQAVQITNT